MSQRPEDAYPGQSIAANADYPDGSAQNNTADGDKLGTPWVDDLINDIWGFHQALIIAGSVTPNGVPDTATASDKMTALLNVIAAGSGTKTGGIIESSEDPAAVEARGFLEIKEGVRFISKTTYSDLLFAIGLGYGDSGPDFGLPPIKPRLRPKYAHPGAWVEEVGLPLPSSGDLSPSAIAFNPSNGDQWLTSSDLLDRLYFRAGGVGAWSEIDISALGVNSITALTVDWKRGEIWVGDNGLDELHQINYDGTLIKTFTNVQLVDIDIHIDTGTVWAMIDTGPATGLFRLDRSWTFFRNVDQDNGWGATTPSSIPTRVAVDQDSGDVIVLTPQGAAWRLSFGDIHLDAPIFYQTGPGNDAATYMQVAAPNGGVGGIAVDPGSKTLFAATTEGNNVFISSEGEGAWLPPAFVPGVLTPSALEFNGFDGSLWITLQASGPGNPGTVYRLPAVKLSEGAKSYIKT